MLHSRRPRPAIRRLELTVVQLEEAKRFIQSDRIPHLRLALLLLDNTAEVLMHRAIQDELMRSEPYARMATSLRSDPYEDEEKGRLSLSTLSSYRLSALWN